MFEGSILFWALVISWSILGVVSIGALIRFLIRQRKKTLMVTLGAVGSVVALGSSTAVYATMQTQPSEDPWYVGQDTTPTSSTVSTTQPITQSTAQSTTTIAQTPTTIDHMSSEQIGSTVIAPGDVEPQQIQNNQTGIQTNTDQNYSVVSGDNLWDIASSHVQEGESVYDLWKHIIKDNTSNLRSNNPNLIYPGEEITISHKK